jgi:MATE family multidrug resistance protein
MILWFIPLGTLIWFSEPLLLLAGQDPLVSQVCSHFLKLSLPGFVSLGLFDSTRIFLIAIDHPHATIVIMLFGVPLSSLNNYFFVHKLGLGVTGLAISMNINYFMYFILLSIYCHFVNNPTIRKAWSLPGLDAWRHWGNLLELGMPGVLLYFIDWGCIYSLGFLSGLIGVAELTVMSCVLTIQRFVTAYATGLQMAATVFVANAIGAN